MHHGSEGTAQAAQVLIISIVSVVVIYFVFHNLLQLMLPNGILTGIL